MADFGRYFLVGVLLNTLVLYTDGVDVAILNQYPLVQNSPSAESTVLTCITDGVVQGNNVNSDFYIKVEFSPGGDTFTTQRSTSTSPSAATPTRVVATILPANTNDHRKEAIGVFSCSGTKDGVTRKVSTVKILNSASIYPLSYTHRAIVGESLSIKVQKTIWSTVSTIRLSKNGLSPVITIPALVQDTEYSLDLPITSRQDDGIYSIDVGSATSAWLHSYIRVIVTDCPSNSYGPGCSSPCLCYHGGWCDVSGTCICPPGFTGDNCELACATPDKYGQTCQWSCTDGGRTCRKSLICLPDPYGCECANGYKGFDCDTPCDTGEYGPGCTNQCNCANGETCDVNKGCLCTGDWRGPTCQENKFRISVDPPSVHITAAARTTATVTCSCHPWTTDDCGDHEMTASAPAAGNEVTLTPQSENDRRAEWTFTPPERLGLIQLQCSVNGMDYIADIEVTGAAPSIAFNPRDVDVNLGQSVTVTCGANGDPEPIKDDFTLTKPDNSVIHQASSADTNATAVFSTFQLSEVTHAVDGQYICRVHTIAGDAISQPNTIAVKDQPVPLNQPSLSDVGRDNIQVNAITNSQSFSGDGPIEKVTVRYRELPDGQWKQVDAPSGQSRIDLTGLTQDTEYNITVVLTRPGPGGTGGDGPSIVIRTKVPSQPLSVVAGAAGGSAALVLLILVVVVLYFFRRRQKKRPRSPPARNVLLNVTESTEASFVEEQSNNMIRQPDMPENVAAGPIAIHHTEQLAIGVENSEPIPLKIMAVNHRELSWNDISLTNKLLGSGNFGEVRKGTINLEGERVPSAIKILKRGADEASRQDFQQEVDIMHHVGYHPNIINLLGTCDHQGQQYLALEMAANGDLKNYLRKSRVLEVKDPAYANTRQTVSTVSTLSPVQLLRIACDVATGMDHLSSKDVIHRDLAARNVLLTDSLIAKVADFGLSRGEGIYEQTSKKAVPFRSTALEALSRRIYTTQSDVWSFGILLWEIVTLGGTPYSGMKSRTLLRSLREGYRLPKPRNCEEDLYQMMLQCWQRRPEDRPTFSDLVEQLRGMMEDKSSYVNTENDDDFEYAVVDSDDMDDDDDETITG